METLSATKKAWNPSGIGWLAFFFSFFPAGILYAYNYSRLGKPQLKRPVIIGVTVVLFLVLISLFTLNVDKNFYQFINIIAALLFYSSQKTDFSKFLSEGGAKASFKLPFFYSLLFTVVLVAGAYGYYTLEARPLKLVNNQFESVYITATIPNSWNVYKNESGDKDTIIYLQKENGIANISIDHIQDFLEISNSVTIKKYSPKQILDGRLKSIEEAVKSEPSAGWTNFRRSDEIQEIDFKGLPAAEGHFIVDENILGAKEKTERKIKRIVIFTDDDLYNVVFAATDASKFMQEEKGFNDFINNLTIK